ncbi:MAG: DNA-protecting protein DprA [Acidobacteria bacterium]|nr:DNA-protecting protein DprA [Acidobacteriota bacterium]MBK8148273.1 DNA-protecting protein DprA [Acidobacteriota bacterium]
MKTWISLNMTPGVGPRAATKLLERFGSADGVFHATRRELESLRLRAETVESILKREFHDRAETELERVREIGGDVLLLDDGSYPFLLREIDDPPIVLYVRGNWQACFDDPGIAVIGSRRCSTYGENAAEMLSRDLAEHGIAIVSGLARGVDTASHRGAIRGKGRTIGVLGTGIDRIYPKENAKLADAILDSGGAIVTQFPLGTPPLGENFPYRNRIISGLSLGVLLVEATDRSGSLITARLASEQNREVFAVPGNITSRNSIGTNYLIKSGAKLVQQWQDVVCELPTEISSRILPPKLDDAPPELPKQPGLAPAGLSERERCVWFLLRSDETVHFDELLAKSGLGFGELNSILVGLDLKDLIKVLPGNHYARKL